MSVIERKGKQMAKRNGKISEGETVALIHHYGERIARAGGGLAGSSRRDVIEWAERVVALARTLPAKNAMYLCDD